VRSIGSPPTCLNAGRYLLLSETADQSHHLLQRSVTLRELAVRLIILFGPSNTIATSGSRYAYALSVSATSDIEIALEAVRSPVATTGFAFEALPATIVTAASVPPVLPP